MPSAVFTVASGGIQATKPVAFLAAGFYFYYRRGGYVLLKDNAPNPVTLFLADHLVGNFVAGVPRGDQVGEIEALTPRFGEEFGLRVFS